MKLPWLRLASLVMVLATALGGPAMAVEEPAYTVSAREGNLELRDYPALIAARVTVGGDRGAAVNAGFRLLATYIFGGNTRKESIAMTAPVVQAPSGHPPSRGETIPMTAPVTQSGGPGAWEVSFIMPRGSTLASLPVPNDTRVRLVALPASRLAVARFSGLTGDEAIRRQTADLEAFIARRRLHAVGPPSLSRYDPPWTPWFMRRNEIWIPVAAP
jgi:hypothetical protein